MSSGANTLGRIRDRARWRRAGMSRKKYVVTRRSDGLGERLNAMLNGLRLADLLDVEFRFAWPSTLSTNRHHAIGDPHDLFSAEFLDRHLETDPDAEGYPLPTGTSNDLASLRAQLQDVNGLHAPHRPLSTMIDPVAVPEVTRGLSTEFAKLEWTPHVQSAIDLARGIDLGTAPVGIHLRAGDNLYGTYGRWARYTEKVMSAPVARALTERYAAEGRQVIVFGQDAEIIKELCSSTAAQSAADLHPDREWSTTAIAMFDLALLARCELIISGNSGFAYQAAAISDNTVMEYMKLLSPAEIVRVSEEDLRLHGDRYSPVQRSFAFWLAYYLARHELPDDQAVRLLESAVDADPKNERHFLHLAARHFRAGRIEHGERVLLDVMARDLARGKIYRSADLFALLTIGGFDALELFPDFDKAIDSGSAVAALFRAAVRARSEESVAADLALFVDACSLDPRLADLAEPAEFTIRFISARPTRA